MVKISERTWNDMSDYRESLEHYGRKGQKWGQHIFGKERIGTKRRKRAFSEKIKDRRAKRAANRVSRAKARAEKEQQEAQKRAAKQQAVKEKKRQSILNNPTSLYKHRREFTADEIQAAMKQFEWEKKLNEYSKTDLKNGADYINTIFQYVNNASNLYNAAARIANSFSPDTNLPIIKTIKELEDGKKKDKK